MSLKIIKGSMMKIFLKISVIAAVIFVLLISSACTIGGMFDEAFGTQDIVDHLDLDLDEKEIASISISDQRMEEKYDISIEDISNIADELDDPFEPFYIGTEQTEEENVLKLENIYTKDGDEYAEISLNEFQYLLKEGDIFNIIYQVQSINPDSVALLKGDEIITLFIDEVKYDQT